MSENDADKKANLLKSLLKSQKVSEETIPEDVKKMYYLFSPSDLHAAQLAGKNLDRHGLYTILSDASGAFSDSQNPKELTPAQQEVILKKVSIANTFLDETSDPIYKKEIMDLASNHTITPTELTMRITQRHAGKINPDEEKVFLDRFTKMKLAAEKEGVERAKRDKYEEYRQTYRPNLKLFKRTLAMLGIGAAITFGVNYLINASWQDEKRDFYENKVKPAVEQIARERGLSGEDIEERLLPPLLPGTVKDSSATKGYKGSSENKTNVDTIANNPVNTLPPKTETKNETKPESKPEDKIIKYGKPGSIDEILVVLKDQLSRDNTERVTFAKYQTLPALKLKALRSNNVAAARLDSIYRMDTNSDDFLNNVSEKKLTNKMNALRSLINDFSNSSESYDAQRELAWIMFDNMDLFKNQDNFKEYDRLVRNYGNTEYMSAGQLYSILTRRLSIEWWKNNQLNVDRSPDRQEQINIGKSLAWLKDIASGSNLASREASYLLAQMISGNTFIYDISSEKTSSFLIEKNWVDNAQNMSLAIQKYYAASGADSLRYSRAKYSFGLSNYLSPQSVLENMGDALAFARNAIWTPNVLYAIAEAEINLGQLNFAEGCINILQNYYPNNEYAKKSSALSDNIASIRTKKQEEVQKIRENEWQKFDNMTQKEKDKI